MKEFLKIIELDKYKIGIFINSLHDMRSKLISKQKETDLLDELLKVLNFQKKFIILEN